MQLGHRDRDELWLQLTKIVEKSRVWDFSTNQKEINSQISCRKKAV